MPTYVYRCRGCGHQFEHVEKMSSRTKSRKCQACGDRADRQISGGAGFLFKGEGFYITDYRSAEYRSKEKAETGKEKAESGKAESGKVEAGKAEPAAATSAEAAGKGPEAVADKTAAKPDVARKHRRGAKKRRP
jgi:putative FmdB family regulatory protein